MWDTTKNKTVGKSKKEVINDARRAGNIQIEAKCI